MSKIWISSFLSTKMIITQKQLHQLKKKEVFITNDSLNRISAMLLKKYKLQNCNLLLRKIEKKQKTIGGKICTYYFPAAKN